MQRPDVEKLRAVLEDCRRMLRAHDERNAALHRAEVIHSPLTGAVETELRRLDRIELELDVAEKGEREPALPFD